MKIAIFGGTFDPVHNGHLKMIDTARKLLAPDEIVIVPTGNKPYKLFDAAPAEDRIRMLFLALGHGEGEEGAPRVRISDIETIDEDVSYTVNTVKKLKEDYPEGTEFFLLMGEDTFGRMWKWPGHDEIRSMCRVAVVPRGENSSMEEAPDFVLGDIKCDISSEKVKKRLKSGESIADMVPQEVDAYIKSKKMYRSE